VRLDPRYTVVMSTKTTTTSTYFCDLCNDKVVRYDELFHIPVAGLPVPVDFCGSCCNERIIKLYHYIERIRSREAQLERVDKELDMLAKRV
jgi:hypothetical protein